MTPDRPTPPRPRPSHPKLAGAVVIVGVLVLLFALAALSTFRG